MNRDTREQWTRTGARVMPREAVAYGRTEASSPRGARGQRGARETNAPAGRWAGGRGGGEVQWAAEGNKGQRGTAAEADVQVRRPEVSRAHCSGHRGRRCLRAWLRLRKRRLAVETQRKQGAASRKEPQAGVVRGGGRPGGAEATSMLTAAGRGWRARGANPRSPSIHWVGTLCFWQLGASKTKHPRTSRLRAKCVCRTELTLLDKYDISMTSMSSGMPVAGSCTR